MNSFVHFVTQMKQSKFELSSRDKINYKFYLLLGGIALAAQGNSAYCNTFLIIVVSLSHICDSCLNVSNDYDAPIW